MWCVEQSLEEGAWLSCFSWVVHNYQHWLSLGPTDSRNSFYYPHSHSRLHTHIHMGMLLKALLRMLTALDQMPVMPREQPLPPSFPAKWWSRRSLSTIVLFCSHFLSIDILHFTLFSFSYSLFFMRNDSIQTWHISLTFFSEQKQNKHNDWTAAIYKDIKQISFDTWLLPVY